MRPKSPLALSLARAIGARCRCRAGGCCWRHPRSRRSRIGGGSACRRWCGGLGCSACRAARTVHTLGSAAAGDEGLAELAGGLLGVARTGISAAASGLRVFGDSAAEGLAEPIRAGERAGLDGYWKIANWRTRRKLGFRSPCAGARLGRAIAPRADDAQRCACVGEIIPHCVDRACL